MVHSLRWLAWVGIGAVVLFGAAGRLDLPWFWAYVGVNAAFVLVRILTLERGLQEERSRPGPGSKQMLPVLFLAMPSYLGHLVVAGLDAGRFHWSGTVPPVVHAAGLAVHALAWALVWWAMMTNRFFSQVVRIQRERGHHPITSGPYQYIRHPGYLGGLLCLLSGPFALGSWWALVPIVPMIAMVVRRTVHEDRFLRGELEGYAQYAGKVRYRLVPGVW